jgi:transcription termination factor Rho
VTDTPTEQSAPETSTTTASETDAPTRSRPARRSGGALGGKVLAELREIAAGLGIDDAAKLRKGELIDAIKAARGEAEPTAVQAGPAPERPAQDAGRSADAPQGRGQRSRPAQDEPPSGTDQPGADQSDGSQTRGGEGRRGDGQRAPRNEGQRPGQKHEGQKNDKNDGQKNEGQKNDKNDSQKNDGQKSQTQGGNDGADRDDEAGGRRRNRRGRNRGGRGADGEPTYTEDDVLVPAAGILDILDNYAFVRTTGYLPSENDVYVSLSMVRKWGLRKGDAVTGQVRQPREGERKEKFNPMVRVDTVNGTPLEDARGRVDFSALTPVHPEERLVLETEPSVVTTRLIDLFAPVGKGQRSLVVSPTRGGRSALVRTVADAITTNNPECHLMVVLIDERPEEVTELKRSVKGEVIASTFDRPASDHTTVAELAIERAKRLVELGHDVVVVLDSLTRLGRAYHQASTASGRTAGAVDTGALHPVKTFFGAARHAEDGGSLTILATALAGTSSVVDEAVLEEIDGAANSVLRLHLDEGQRVFPAVDVAASRTNHDELLLDPQELEIITAARRAVAGRSPQEALEAVVARLEQTGSNAELLLQLSRTPLG